MDGLMKRGDDWMAIALGKIHDADGFYRTKYIIFAKLMTVKWDMQQKHGSPPKVMRKSSCYFEWNVMTPVHFTALSMVDISYFVDAKHHCQHAASKQMDVQYKEVSCSERERREGSVKWGG